MPISSEVFEGLVHEAIANGIAVIPSADGNSDKIRRQFHFWRTSLKNSLRLEFSEKIEALLIKAESLRARSRDGVLIIYRPGSLS